MSWPSQYIHWGQSHGKTHPQARGEGPRRRLTHQVAGWAGGSGGRPQTDSPPTDRLPGKRRRPPASPGPRPPRSHDFALHRGQPTEKPHTAARTDACPPRGPRRGHGQRQEPAGRGAPPPSGCRLSRTRGGDAAPHARTHTRVGTGEGGATQSAGTHHGPRTVPAAPAAQTYLQAAGQARRRTHGSDIITGGGWRDQCNYFELKIPYKNECVWREQPRGEAAAWRPRWQSHGRRRGEGGRPWGVGGRGGDSINKRGAFWT